MLWYNLSLWHYFDLLLKYIQFLCWGFPFFTISRSSHMQFHQFVYLEVSIQLFFFSFLFSVFLLLFYCLSLGWHCCYGLLQLVFFLLSFVGSLSSQIVAFMQLSVLESPLSSSFLDIYSLFISSLSCKALCIIINFLVLWSIPLIFSLDHFMNGQNYLTRRTAQVFTPFSRFLPQSLVLRSFLVLLKYTFLTFSFIYVCLMIYASNIPKYLQFSFSLFWYFPYLAVLFLALFLFFSFSLSAWCIFQCQKFYSYTLALYSYCL